MRRAAIALILGLLALPAPLQADSEASSYVSIGVGDTAMVIAGQTSPNAFVTVMDFGQTVGAIQADATGAFLLHLPAQRSEVHKPAVYAFDTDGVLTDTLLLPVSLFEHEETTVNFFLPPSLRVLASNSPGGLSQIKGQTAPLVTVYLSFDNQFAATVTSDADGLWSYDIDPVNLRYGTHTVTVRAQTTLGELSAESRKVDFLVARSSGGPVVIPPPPTPSPTPAPPTVGSATSPSSPTIIVPRGPIKVGFPTPQTIELPIVVTPAAPDQPRNVQVAVDWGDGKTDTYYLDSSEITLSHRYDKVGNLPIRLYAWASNGIIEQYNWNVRLYSTMEQMNRLLEVSFLLAFLIYLLETEARQRQLAHRHQKVEKNFPIG